MIRKATWALLTFLLLLSSACSFGSLGRVTVNGQDAPQYLSQVHVLRDNTLLPTEPGMALKKGDVIETDGDATVALHFAGADAVLFPKTKIAILNPSIFEWFGKVWVNGLFTTKTKYANATAEGTEYVVEVEPDGETTTVTVVEGHVRCVSPDGRWGAFLAERAERVRVTGYASSAPNVARNRLSDEEYNALLRRLSAAGLTERLVPNVTGFVLARAQQELALSGITVIETQLAPVEPERLGLVLSQSPQPGGHSAQIRLILGARAVPVPNLIGRSLEEARALLSPVHLSVGKVTEKYTGQHTPHSIIEQSPAAAAPAPEGGRVTIATEVEPVVVPSLIHHTPVQAAALLAARGLHLGTVTERLTLDSAPGISEQVPQPEQKVGPGSAVDVVVLIAGTRVPRLAGLAGTEIDAVLGAAGLARGETTKREIISDLAVQKRGTPRDGTVLDQTPTPDSVVARGSRIDLVVAAATIKMCSVPAASGQSPTEISAQFQAAGLSAVVQIDSNGGGRFGIVSQSTEAGQQVQCGTKVTVHVVYFGPS